jgi:hypothetical protein
MTKTSQDSVRPSNTSGKEAKEGIKMKNPPHAFFAGLWVLRYCYWVRYWIFDFFSAGRVTFQRGCSFECEQVSVLVVLRGVWP